MLIEFFVPGIAKTAGSKKAFPLFAGKKGDPNRRWIRNIVTDDAGEQGANWRESVRAAAICAMGGADPIRDIPLRLHVVFTMKRLKGHYRASGELKGSAPEWHTVKPDATKLMRAIEDAITGICWHDDAQIADQHAQKRYGSKPGARVIITDEILSVSRPGVCLGETTTPDSRGLFPRPREL